MSSLNGKIHDNIEQYGWATMGVGGGVDEEGHGGPFSYSQGLMLLGHPDIFITGLHPRTAHGFISMIYESVKAGNRYEPGVDYTDLAEGFPARFRRVDPFWVHEHMTATWIYYGEFHPQITTEALQLVYPDAQGRWPWEAGCDRKIVRSLPRLDLPPTYPRPERIRALLDTDPTPSAA